MKHLKDYIFHDKDIEGVLIEPHNVVCETIEILIKPGTEAILLSDNDVAAMANHFYQAKTLLTKEN